MVSRNTAAERSTDLPVDAHRERGFGHQQPLAAQLCISPPPARAAVQLLRRAVACSGADHSGLRRELVLFWHLSPSCFPPESPPRLTGLHAPLAWDCQPVSYATVLYPFWATLAWPAPPLTLFSRAYTALPFLRLWHTFSAAPRSMLPARRSALAHLDPTSNRAAPRTT